MAPGVAENVRVVLRVRPLTRKEIERGEDELIRVASNQAVQVSPTRHSTTFFLNFDGLDVLIAKYKLWIDVDLVHIHGFTPIL
jgi:hypothetical protein